jgi:hypothetical protein
MTTTTCQARPVVDAGSQSAALITAGVELTKGQLQDALKLVQYSWTVETRYGSNSKGSGTVTACFAGGSKCRKTSRYNHELQPMEAHLEGAMAFLNGLDNGCSVYRLVAVASTERGYVFTFCG